MSTTDKVLCATTPNAKPKRTDNAATKLEPLLPRLPIEPLGKFGAVIVRANDRTNDSPQNKPKHAPPCNRAYQLKMTQCRQWRRHFFCSISSFFLFDFFSKMPLSARKKRESKDKKRKQTIGWVWLFQKRKQFCVLLPCFFYKCAFLLLSEIKKETVYKHHLMLVKSCVYQTSIEQETTRVTHFYGFCLLSLTQFFGGSADIWIIRRNDWRHSQSCVLVIERVRERASEIERNRKCSIIHDNAAIALGRQMLNALITLESLKDFD